MSPAPRGRNKQATLVHGRGPLPQKRAGGIYRLKYGTTFFYVEPFALGKSALQ